MTQSWIRALGSARIFFYCLLLLILLLLMGTISQRWLGLFQAQEVYFSAWITWIGPLPCPGARLIMTIMTINLCFHLLDRRYWALKKSGILIAHIGSLLLLIGGFITALSSTEGSMSLLEGESANSFTNYHQLELILIDHSNRDHDQIISIPDSHFKANAKLTISGVPAAIHIHQFFRNAKLVPRKNPVDVQGLSGRFDLVELTPAVEDGENESAIWLRSPDGNGKEKEIYVVENMQFSPSIFLAGKNYELQLRHRLHRLPFQIQLIDFVRQLHPGTQTPKSYHSDILLIDGNTQFKHRIEMNRPLRHRGYTFYQSSFIQSAASETSIFAVVQNSGRLFPYISSIIICIGLLIHLFLKYPKLVLVILRRQ